ncbi:MAG: alpha/beta hydrolase [Lewinellaceae bacterium]|nr:alpha/beta hydrolase [Lewinellaceae bacterium]MCB9289404.1 alpha/beta hydrolase [Lewinellaceae bacterium]
MSKIVYRLFRKKRTYFSIAALLFFLYAYDFMEMRISTETFQHILSENPFGYQATFDYYEVDGRKVRYLEIGNDSLPLIVFIHGAPSSSSFWKGFLRDSTLLAKAKLMAVDRPGYGYSGYGEPETSVKKQAELIAGIIREKRGHHPAVILHGSSYGGTVAARIAMDFPKLVDGLLLQSASVAPGEEKTYDFSYITEHFLLRWMLPGSIHVANQEKLSHKIQLDSMANLWGRIRAAAIVLHGSADRLIYPQNAFYAKERLVNASYLEMQMLPGSKHDLLWTQRTLLEASLEKLLQLATKKAPFSEGMH